MEIKINLPLTHMKFRANPGNFFGLNFVGQSDLHITYYRLPHVWYTPWETVGTGYVTQHLRNPIVL